MNRTWFMDRLSTLVAMRRYDEVNEIASWVIQEEGWDYFMETLDLLPPYIILPKTRRTMNCVDITQGRKRDSLLNVLDLGGIVGLDCDPRKEFSGLKGPTLEDIRHDAQEIAQRLLREQIRRGNTFFMDTERLLFDMRFVEIIPSIVKARRDEILALEGSTADMSQVMKTYYGYHLLCAWSNRPIKEFKKEMSSIFKMLGAKVRTSIRNFSIRKSNWKHVSGTLQTILSLILHTHTVHMDQRGSLIGELIKIDDSRIIDTLVHHYSRSRTIAGHFREGLNLFGGKRVGELILKDVIRYRGGSKSRICSLVSPGLYETFLMLELDTQTTRWLWGMQEPSANQFLSDAYRSKNRERFFAAARILAVLVSDYSNQRWRKYTDMESPYFAPEKELILRITPEPVEEESAIC